MKISLSGKEYESGEITREKYRKFAAVYESLLGKEQNAEIMNKTNLQAEAVAKTLKTNVITIGGKEYESGKIGRKKYRAFREVYNDLVKPEKQTYTDEELDRMVTAIVEIYDNQFSFEAANEELTDVSQIIFNFALINANIIKRLGEQAEEAKKNLSSRA